MSSPGIRGLRGGGGAGEVADLGGGEIATHQAAEEVVAGDHVDPRLRRRVEPAREAAQPRVVVGDLDPDPEPDLAAVRFVVPVDVDLQVAVAAGATLGDQ